MSNTLRPLGNISGHTERQRAKTEQLWAHQSLNTLLTSSGSPTVLQVDEEMKS